MPDIDFQKIVLNLIPKKGDEPVVFYASQYETTRPFIADLMWGETEFAPGDDCWAEIDIRKNDDNLVVITDDVAIDNNEVSVILPVQALTCIGNNLGQVKIYAGEDQLIAALNFILEVQPDPLAGGVTSETAIDNLTEQIEEITQQVIGDDYYDKTEVNDLLDLKADKATTYTKTEVDNALNLKADKSTTYTKTQTDNLLNDKADKATTYTKTQVDNALALKANTADLATVATTGDYDDLTNKPTIPAAQVQSDYAQADNTKVDYIKNKPDLSVFVTSDALSEIIYDLLPAGTASGAIANFDTDLSLPLVECKANIVASQASGTPTPSTPIPINGYTSCTISVADENMSVQDTHTVSWQDEAGTVYGGVLDVTRGKLHVTWTKAKLDQLNWTRTTSYNNPFFYATLGNNKHNGDSLINNGFTKTTGNASDFGNNAPDESYAIGRSSYQMFVRYDACADTTALITAFENNEVAYELATPFDIDLTPVQINALLGVNNVYNDTNGDTEVKYKDSIQHYVDTRI